MVYQLVAMLGHDFALAFLDLGIHELDDFTGIHVDHMVVVTAIGQFEHRMTAVEVVANHQTRRFELGQYAVDGGQAHVLASLHQRLVDILGAHVTLLGGVEHLKDLDSRQGHLETGFAQFAIFNHGQLSRRCCFAASLNTGMIGVYVVQPR